MQRAIDETSRRRDKQMAFNQEHHITPTSIRKKVADIMEGAYGRQIPGKGKHRVAESQAEYHAMTPQQAAKEIKKLEKQMRQHAKQLEFEQAADIRDRILEIEQVFKLG